MSISSINYSSSVLGSQIRNINQQLTDLSTQLSTGKLSQNYSGMGTNEGFAIASRAQLSNIAAYTDTITNVNVNINLANTALQALTTIRNTVQTGSANTAQDLNVNGQTVAMQRSGPHFSGRVFVPAAEHQRFHSVWCGSYGSIVTAVVRLEDGRTVGAYVVTGGIG